MLDCKACIRSCLRSIFGDVLQTANHHQQTHAIQLHRRWPHRTHYTAAPTVQGQEPLSTVPALSFRRKGFNQYGEQRVNSIAKGQQFKRTDLRRELPFLRDPLKLANHTLGLLRQDEQKKALEIVRLASSKKVSCTVSWNHLVDYEMNRGHVTDAIKIYNEMKKRAQPPDSHTYTIILRGLAVHKTHAQSLIHALSVYNSMFAPNSPVKPSITHSNAVLKVCARRLDMDALYGIAAKLPTHGAGAPDNLTFTTILNAVRHSAWTFDGSKIDEKPEETAERRQRATMEGRRMWDDIIKRWRKGDIWIDEELVCAMGRLLLISRHPQDLDDVLSLVEQTMAIPRAIPRINAPERPSVAPVPARLFPMNPQRQPTGDEAGMSKITIGEEDEGEEEQRENRLEEAGEEERLKGEAEEVLEDFDEEKGENVHFRQTDQPDPPPELDEASQSSGANSMVHNPVFSPVLSDNEFSSVDIRHAKVFNRKTHTTQPVAYVRPGNNTLSLLMDACIGMRAATAAQDYWVLLTASVPAGGHGIAPDAENYFMYLRLLRLTRSSRLAIDLVEESLGSDEAQIDKSNMLVLGPMASTHGRALAVPKTFRIAMSACVRDKANPRALDHATRLLRLMQARLPEPDLVALGMYLEVAAASGVRTEARSGEKVAWKRHLEAIEVAEVSFRNLKSLLNFGYGEVGLEEEEKKKRMRKNGTRKREMEALDDERRLGNVLEDRQALADETGDLPRHVKPRRDRVPDKTRKEALDLAQGMVSAYDRVLDGGKEEMDRTVRGRCLRMRHTWAAYISRGLGCGMRQRFWEVERGVNVKVKGRRKARQEQVMEKEEEVKWEEEEVKRKEEV